MSNSRPAPDRPAPCRCGTGRYCHRHLAYNCDPSPVAVAQAAMMHVRTLTALDDPPTGGGRRVVRKSLTNQNY